MIRFADSHAHLADPAFDGDREEVLVRARDAGAALMICIGESPAAAKRAHELAARNPGDIRFTAGVHPHDASSYQADDLQRLREFAALGAVAIGECGLDYHYDNAPRTLQRRAFADQLALALELRLPVVVHTREAEDDTIAIIREAGHAGVRGVLHCFTGGAALLSAGLEAGWFVSFSGVVTFRKWSGDDLVREVPSDRILAESDAPYLAPHPQRGKRNEPALVALTVQHLAEARSVSIEELARSVLENACSLFGVAPQLGDLVE